MEGDIGAQRGFAHRRAGGQDDQFRRLQPAQQRVQVFESGLDADTPAILLVGGFGLIERPGEYGGEWREIDLRFAGGRQGIELLFGLFDLCGGVEVEIDIVGFVDDIGADLDQRPAQVPVEHGPPVVAGIDDRDDGGGKAGQIVRAADLVERPVALEQVLERDRIGDLAHLDQFADRAEDPAVAGIGKMLDLEEIGDAVERPVVGEQGAEQRHLRLVVVRRHAEGGALVQAVHGRTASIETAGRNRTRTFHATFPSLCAPRYAHPDTRAGERRTVQYCRRKKRMKSDRKPIDPEQSYAQIVKSVEKSQNGPAHGFGRFRGKRGDFRALHLPVESARKSRQRGPGLLTALASVRHGMGVPRKAPFRFTWCRISGRLRPRCRERYSRDR